MVLEAIKYKRGELRILDQLRLPFREHYDVLRDSTDGWRAIKEMRTRGAPAIAIVAALSLAVELETSTLSSNAEEVLAFIVEKLQYLVTSRPTAVNLADAVTKLSKIVTQATSEGNANGQSVKDAYIVAAEKMLVDDVHDNEAIGKHGAEWIMKSTEQGKSGKVSIVTHCNTGSLATAGYGTALGVIRSLHADGSLKHAFCTETRPYNQGSRLTAFELVHDSIPATLITDSMASALLRLKGPSESIAAIVVGADRVAANGDTANKIGTYQLAITARHHGIKFLVAAPRTTIDLGTASGADIVIEERPEIEMVRITGPQDLAGKLDVDHVSTVRIAAEGVGVWNPSFDVTPAKLIDGIITEVGVAEKDASGKYTLEPLFQMGGLENKPSKIGDM